MAWGGEGYVKKKGSWIPTFYRSGYLLEMTPVVQAVSCGHSHCTLHITLHNTMFTLHITLHNAYAHSTSHYRTHHHTSYHRV